MEEELRDLVRGIMKNFKYILEEARIYKKNVTARMVSNNAAKTLMLLSEMGESANMTMMTLRNVIELNGTTQVNEGIKTNQNQELNNQNAHKIVESLSQSNQEIEEENKKLRKEVQELRTRLELVVMAISS
ncbi:hypothetical protein C1645_878226 [Glomus cerebriforme]|uniref:Uncharacterized protein n=1 Tax=Glomus cerebriforme TaxID=658196 RepID=A0A397SWM4_9GLOM|nr:hypothetical protein C1645_878226 [Glomus cerebriforme]